MTIEETVFMITELELKYLVTVTIIFIVGLLGVLSGGLFILLAARTRGGIENVNIITEEPKREKGKTSTIIRLGIHRQ